MGPINAILNTMAALIKFLIAWPIGFAAGFTPAWKESGNLLEGIWWQRKQGTHGGYKYQLVGPTLAVLGIAGFLFWLNPQYSMIFSVAVVFILLLIKFWDPASSGVVTVTQGTGKAIGKSWLGQIVSYLIVRRLTCRKVIYK